MGRNARRAAVVALLVCLSGTTLLAGQACRGYAPFLQHQLIHPFLRGQFNDEASTTGVGLGVGSPTVFGDFSLQGVRVDQLGGSGKAVGGDFGLQANLDQQHIIQVCPIAEFSFQMGPNNFDGAGTNYGENDLSLGASVGVTAVPATHAVSVIPTWTYAYLSQTNRLTASNGASNSHTRGSSVVTLGVGFVFSQQVSITPSLSWISNSAGTLKTYAVRLVFVPGGPKTQLVNRRATPCAGFASNDSTVYDTSQVSERPHLKSVPELRFPEMQRSQGIAGRVIVDVIIGADGTPEMNSAQLFQKVDPGLDKEALTWIGGASYWPACKDGDPVRVRIRQSVDFCPQGCPQPRP